MLMQDAPITSAVSSIRRPPGAWRRPSALLLGIGLTAVVAAVATAVSPMQWPQSVGLSALTLAIVFGMLVGNTLYPRIAGRSALGVTFCKQTVLRTGIVLFGLRLTFQDIAAVGGAGVLIDVTVMCTTFALSWWLGTRVFGLERKTAMLIGVGSAICGAAAVMAAEPVVRGRAEQVTVAVATVVVFGTLAIFTYPALYHLSLRYGAVLLSPGAFGIYAGSTIHEVAQVVAVGRSISEDAANAAVITKMVRVMMLAPFLVALSAYLSRRPESGDAQGIRRIRRPHAPSSIVVPWFALGFVAVAALHSVPILPPALVANLTSVDTFLLAMAMAALGMTTHVSALRAAGIKPLLLSAALFVWLIVGGLAINLGVVKLLGG